MVGQGIGHVFNREFQERANAILPLVDIFLVRDSRVAPKLLNSFGVKPDRIYFTGDDAVEMAYNARNRSVGTSIGVNLRIARYTNIGVDDIEIVRQVLQEAAINFGAKMISLPVSQSSLHDTSSDAAAIRQLFEGFENAIDSKLRFETPNDLIRRTSKCRIVVTGAYHPAVFALSQGIPVVGLARSAEYMVKLSGLADEFGRGCEVIQLNQEGIADTLAAAIDTAWQSAEDVRPKLLVSAKRQVDAGRSGYQILFDMVNSR
jgi:colanic acid/amylovoran biosynthesis protein